MIILEADLIQAKPFLCSPERTANVVFVTFLTSGTINIQRKWSGHIDRHKVQLPDQTAAAGTQCFLAVMGARRFQTPGQLSPSCTRRMCTSSAHCSSSVPPTHFLLCSGRGKQSNKSPAHYR